MSTFPKYNFQFNQGATFTKTFISLDASDAPIDLTGYNGRMQFRTSYTAASPSISLDSESLGGIVIDPLLGKLTISMTATQTENLAARDYVYDIEIYTSLGYVKRLVEGVATCRAEATR